MNEESKKPNCYAVTETKYVKDKITLDMLNVCMKDSIWESMRKISNAENANFSMIALHLIF
jgi:hypothetical protein